MLASATAACDDSASGPDSGRMADTLIGPAGMLEHWPPDEPPPAAAAAAALLVLLLLLEHAATASTTATARPASSDIRRGPRRRDSGMCCIRILLSLQNGAWHPASSGMIKSRR